MLLHLISLLIYIIMFFLERISFAISSNGLLMLSQSCYYKCFYVLCVVFFLFSCGKKGPPLPPFVTISEKINDMQVHQVGEKVQVVFSLPMKNIDGSQPAQATKVTIYRTAGTTPVEIKPVVELNDVEINKFLIENKVLLYDNQIPEKYFKEKQELSYYALVDSKKGKNAGPSNKVSVKVTEPLSKPLNPVAELKENKICIKWEYKQPKDESIQFNIYKGTMPEVAVLTPYNTQLVEGFLLEDSAIVPGETVYYLIRAVHKDTKQESDNSDIVQAVYRDVFPPAAPAEVVAVVLKEGIELHWKSVDAMDLGGYKVYRKTKKDTEFSLITPENIMEISFKDSEVEAGKEYEYYITAVDVAVPANESKPSGIVKVKFNPE
ncbi:MAG: hypothetical protein A2Y62_17815 [Candidatus Fischerbacteria bacterium RBG_13_37_8]|uniref:Fibronectin type-III domain-containing protein n=1 Tax=Candidatus Fischerbacteria bacterium RBG_13_37_8 TaxID=1817863 RepID=A0A1F5VP95_9BACT|nr:MAG: hypothetical protein A2Y62_17815 [Candidatus Fischerbacteria bacterium RBG_13_37_8]